MITLEQASDRVGAKVVYRAPHIGQNEDGDEGVITSVNTAYVFVRYGADTHSKATAPQHLQLVAQ